MTITNSKRAIKIHYFKFYNKITFIKKPFTKARYNNILIIINKFTKSVIFLPYEEKSSAGDLTYTFFKEIINNYGLLSEIILNRDRKSILKF